MVIKGFLFLYNFFLSFLFFIYSFIGWILEVVQSAFHQKRLVNRGFINSPLCISYGIGAIVITINTHQMTGLWIFAAAMIDATVIEWFGGHFIEHFYHERWWDYSKNKWNLDGYICLSHSVFWGLLGYIGVKFVNPLLFKFYHLIPPFIRHLIIFILLAVLIIDILATAIVVFGKNIDKRRWESADAYLTKISVKLSSLITSYVDRRVERAYPQRKLKLPTIPKTGVFAQGCGFYKVFLLFSIGSLLGDIIETIFCRLKMGVWMSRSSLVWGPFSIVWGFAFAGVTLLLYRYKDRSDSFLFLTGTFLGGAYEYLCSVLSEIVFGKVFWDYSKMPFNLNGRINLLYCFFWGIAAVVWLKILYPVFSGWIEKLPKKGGKIIMWAAIVFMVINMLISALALYRYNDRIENPVPKNNLEKILDERFDDKRMDRIYPNAKRGR